MGKVIMSGIVPTLKAPVTGVLASSLAVGSTVKLMEGGTAVEYLVVNQGIPENSSLYDASCDGTWLLRKDIHSERQWNSSNVNKYESSAINTWLNGDFFNSLGPTEKSTVKQVKIPYCVGNNTSTIKSGVNGLSCKIFLLGGHETGWTTSMNEFIPEDGAKLSYFEIGNDTFAKSKRIATYNSSRTEWWLRSARLYNDLLVWFVARDGSTGGDQPTNGPYGIRPALVLPSNALFDGKTMLLKGVA